jgi:hypothetical protein
MEMERTLELLRALNAITCAPVELVFNKYGKSYIMSSDEEGALFVRRGK